MAKSKAKKQRQHLVRNGRRDPELSRGNSADFSLHVRKTPTLREKQERSYKKHKREYSSIK